MFGFTGGIGRKFSPRRVAASAAAAILIAAAGGVAAAPVAHAATQLSLLFERWLTAGPAKFVNISRVLRKPGRNIAVDPTATVQTQPIDRPCAGEPSQPKKEKR